MLDVLQCSRELLETDGAIVRQHGEVVHLFDQFGLVIVTRSVAEKLREINFKVQNNFGGRISVKYVSLFNFRSWDNSNLISGSFSSEDCLTWKRRKSERERHFSRIPFR